VGKETLTQPDFDGTQGNLREEREEQHGDATADDDEDASEQEAEEEFDEPDEHSAGVATSPAACAPHSPSLVQLPPLFPGIRTSAESRGGGTSGDDHGNAAQGNGTKPATGGLCFRPSGEELAGQGLLILPTVSAA
jgi:hypothetical protein